MPVLQVLLLGVLSLDEVMASVEATHPLIAAAAADRASAGAESLAAEGAFDPGWRTRAQLVPTGPYPSTYLETAFDQPTALWGTRLFAGYRLGDGPFALYDSKQDTNRYGEVRAGLQVPILRDGAIDRRRAGLERAQLAVDGARAAAAQTRLDLLRLGAQRYYDWVAAGLRAATTRRLLRNTVEREGQLRVRIAAGDLPEYELEENRRAVLQREAQLQAAERALEAAAIELGLFLRAKSGEPQIPGPERLPGALPAPVALPGELVGREGELALARRPELRRLGAVSSQAEVEARLARNQRLPGLDLVVAAARDLGPGDPKRDKVEIEASVLLDIPIRLRAQDGRLRGAEAASSRAEAQLRFASDRALAEVRDARSALVVARERAEVLSREVSVAERLAAAELQRFLLGEGTLLLVNLREQAAVEAALRRIDALADHHRALVAWRVALGLSPGAGAPMPRS